MIVILVVAVEKKTRCKQSALQSSHSSGYFYHLNHHHNHVFLEMPLPDNSSDMLIQNVRGHKRESVHEANRGHGFCKQDHGFNRSQR